MSGPAPMCPVKPLPRLDHVHQRRCECDTLRCGVQINDLVLPSRQCTSPASCYAASSVRQHADRLYTDAQGSEISTCVPLACADEPHMRCKLTSEHSGVLMEAEHTCRYKASSGCVASPSSPLFTVFDSPSTGAISSNSLSPSALAYTSYP